MQMSFSPPSPPNRENYRSASVGDNCDQIFNFCKNMWLLKVDNAEYALLTVIVIFSGGFDLFFFGSDFASCHLN